MIDVDELIVVRCSADLRGTTLLVVGLGRPP
jgi:hypothetical protein